MTTSTAASMIAELRFRRRDLRREIARVRWWRRLVQARRDLTLAALARPEAVASTGLDAAYDALAADAPNSTELAAAVWPDSATFATGDLASLDGIDARLDTYERLLSETLDSVTALMIDALGRAHHGHAEARESEHA